MRTKVFVGNLDFKTQENELAAEFAAAGNVVSANIITRGPRSLGYGFVELESVEVAENAVKLMNKKSINGREINVEIAKERPEGQPNQPNPREGGAPRGRGGFRGGFRGAPRGRGGFRGGAQAVNGAPAPENNTNEVPAARKRRPRPIRQEVPEGEARPPRIARPPRRPIEERNNTPSKTTLFVANLPFALDDEAFGQVFKDDGLAFKSAHVVKKRNNRSKGFGFVEFDNEADQLKSLEKINGKEVKSRELIVKIALTEQKEPNSQKEEVKQEAPSKEEKKPETPKKEEKKPAETEKREQPAKNSPKKEFTKKETDKK